MLYLAMTHLHKHRISSILNWVSSNFFDSHIISSFCYTGNNPRFYRRKAIIVQTERIADKTNEKLSGECHVRKAGFISSDVRKEAQAALLDYLHYTRNLPFTDAENMSKNSPDFLEKLLEKVGPKEDVRKSVSQLLRYFPINEFEPFYESLGLKSQEYSAIIPRDLTFLSDDELLMENYRVLCNYGIERKNLGKFFKEAFEVFGYADGVLALKLDAYEQLGLNHSFVTKMVGCSPRLLIGNVNEDLIEVLQILRKGGIEMSWVEEHLSEKNSYIWRRLLALLDLFLMRGYNEEMLGSLISLHPGILFEDSGNRTLLLVGFLTKFGCNSNQIYSVFEGLPKIQVAMFVSNMRRSFQILSEIDMDASEMGKMIRCHALLLGSYTLKTAGTMLSRLNVGKERLRKFIVENPQELKNLAVGLKVGRLPKADSQSTMLKTNFLMELGFMDKPNKMEAAFKKFRGSGAEIRERFDCLVEAGLDKKDVYKMVKVAPQILNQSKDVIQMKIDFLVNDLGYPISSLVTFPSYLNYTRERVKLRLAMYGWLKDQGTGITKLSWSTLLTYSEKVFVQLYVKLHPKGLEVYEDLKRRIYSDSGCDHLAHKWIDSAIVMDKLFVWFSCAATNFFHHPEGPEIWEDLKRRKYSESGSDHIADNCMDSAIVLEKLFVWFAFGGIVNSFDESRCQHIQTRREKF